MFMKTANAEIDWSNRATRFLKAELKRADVTYKELAERLEKQGLTETEASVANKLSRGTFSAVFLLACLATLDTEIVQLGDL